MLEKMIGNYLLSLSNFFFVMVLQVLISKYMESYHILYFLLITLIKLSFKDKFFDILGYISLGPILLLISSFTYSFTSIDPILSSSIVLHL